MAVESHYEWDGKEWQCKEDPSWRPVAIPDPVTPPKPVQARPVAPRGGRKPKETK